MPGFWELPTAGGLATLLQDLGLPADARLEAAGRFSHAITDTLYTCHVYEATSSGDLPQGYQWVALARAREIPITTISAKAIAVLSLAEQV